MILELQSPFDPCWICFSSCPVDDKTTIEVETSASFADFSATLLAPSVESLRWLPLTECAKVQEKVYRAGG